MPKMRSLATRLKADPLASSTPRAILLCKKALQEAQIRVREQTCRLRPNPACSAWLRTTHGNTVYLVVSVLPLIPETTREMAVTPGYDMITTLIWHSGVRGPRSNHVNFRPV